MLLHGVHGTDVRVPELRENLSFAPRIVYLLRVLHPHDLYGGLTFEDRVECEVDGSAASSTDFPAKFERRDELGGSCFVRRKKWPTPALCRGVARNIFPSRIFQGSSLLHIRISIRTTVQSADGLPRAFRRLHVPSP